MIAKIIKTAIAFLFIPVAIGVTKAFFKSLENLLVVDINTAVIIAGFFTYPIFHIIFMRPVYVYISGHEIVHVLATWVCGGKVTSFNISKEGGSVTTTKSNLFIRLSPYFVPIHVLFLFFLYWVLSKFYNMCGVFNEFVYLIGFTMSFHIFMTIEVMKMRQPDIVKTGYLFSVLFVYVANVVILLLILSLIYKDISVPGFFKDTFTLSKDLYIQIYNTLII